MSKDTRSLPGGFTAPHLLSGMPKDTPILVAFSGGADSSALLYMMAEYARTTGTKIYAAHVNHGIRGEEADRDELHCRNIAKELGVELFVSRVNVPEYAESMKLGIELAARDLRYEFFDDIMSKYSIPLLATAHNANDNLETILFNISRGCGLSGVCGIPPVRKCKNGYVIRPILELSKTQILEYCEKNGIGFVTDSTNTDTDYTRNMIRAQIIPALEQINAGAVENATRLSATLREDAICIESMTDWFLDELEEDMSIDTQKLVGSPAAVASRAIIALYREASGGKSLEQIHVCDVLRLCEKSVAHSKIQLPAFIDARIENGRLYFERRCELPSAPQEFCVTLTDGTNAISEINATIIMGSSQICSDISKNSTLLNLDPSKIRGTLVARQRAAADKIRVSFNTKYFLKSFVYLFPHCIIVLAIRIQVIEQNIREVVLINGSINCHSKCFYPLLFRQSLQFFTMRH